MKKRILACLILCVLLLTGCGSTGGSTGQWPSRKIEIEICYTAGGTADTVARQLAALMGEQLGASFSIYIWRVFYDFYENYTILRLFENIFVGTTHID